ncbi:hypothetical protein DV735_g5987, partial [Chaetothyriales sp. CBS 134920]
MADLRSQLGLFYEYATGPGIGAMRTGPATYRLFRPSVRPSYTTSSLGTYSYRHNMSKVFGTVAVDRQVQQSLRSWIGIDEQIWNQLGSVNVGLFEWTRQFACMSTDPRLQGKSMYELMLLEFDIYQHHLRQASRDRGCGWCTNMVHSLGQQLIRQDPVHYCCHVALRADCRASLVSYPCPTQIQQPGYGVDGADTWQAGSHIGGLVMLDTETSKDCTEILPGITMPGPAYKDLPTAAPTSIHWP